MFREQGSVSKGGNGWRPNSCTLAVRRRPPLEGALLASTRDQQCIRLGYALDALSSPRMQRFGAATWPFSTFGWWARHQSRELVCAIAVDPNVAVRTTAAPSAIMHLVNIIASCLLLAPCWCAMPRSEEHTSELQSL